MLAKQGYGKRLLAGLAVLLLAAFPARAQPAGPTPPSGAGEEHLKRGVACYEQLNYGCAKKEFEAGIAAGETAPLHEHLAYTLIALGEEEQAAAHFRRVFELDPSFRLSPKKVSPKIYRVYRLARRRHEVEQEKKKKSILAESTRTIDQFFSGIVEPIQNQGVSWFAVDLDKRLYLELFTGFSLVVGEKISTTSNTYEGGLTFGAGLLFGPNEHLSLGPTVRYSTHPERGAPSPTSLDILQAGAEIRFQEFSDTFLFYLALGGGGAWSGRDNVNTETGWYIAPSIGARAIVTNNLSLGVSGGLTVLDGAGAPGNDRTFEVPVLFQLSYLY
ncbi:MAG: hypothetical protein AB1405_02555 [Bdellovibrionota bacterium]